MASKSKKKRRVQGKNAGKPVQGSKSGGPVQEESVKKPARGTGEKLIRTLQNAGRTAAGKISTVAGDFKEEWLGATKTARLLMSVMAAAAAVFFLLFIVQSVRLSGTLKGRKSAEAMSKNLQEEMEQLQEKLLEQEKQNMSVVSKHTQEGAAPTTSEGWQAPGSEREPALTQGLMAPTPTEVLPTPAPERHYLVCVDAGHGGFDGGAVLREHGEEVRIESKDNLVIAKLFEKALKERGIEVRMTRDDDTFLELEERAAIANAVKADLMVSLHRNSYYDADGNTNGSVEGVEIWLHTSKPKNATLLAEQMLAAMEGVGITKNRGVKFGTMGDSTLNYAINRYAAMDSMIVELGFVTSTADNRNFDDYSADYADALAEVVEAWLKEYIPLE